MNDHGSMVLDDELAERLGQRMARMNTRTTSLSPTPGGRSAPTGASARVKRGRGRLISSLQPFANLLPSEIEKADVKDQERLTSILMAAGCHAYAHLKRFLSSLPGPTANGNRITDFIPRPPAQLTSEQMVMLSDCLDEAVDTLRNVEKVQTTKMFDGITTEMAATALTLLTASSFRRPPSRSVESVMAASQNNAGQEEGEPEGTDQPAEEPIPPPPASDDSLLGLACTSGMSELASLILRVRKSADFLGETECTPLMEVPSPLAPLQSFQTCAAGHLSIVEQLLAYGADVNQTSVTNNTALIYAAAAGFHECVRALLKTGKCHLEVKNENGHCAMMEAASAGHLEIVKMLVEAGGKGMAVTEAAGQVRGEGQDGIPSRPYSLNQESPLTLASYKGHVEVVRFLLPLCTGTARAEELHTALMEACMDGHTQVADLLMKAGAEVNFDSESYESPLTLAACGGHTELVEMLLKAGAAIEEPNDESYTPLMEAAREGCGDVVRVLLQAGAIVNAQTEETGETAMTLAACGGYTEVVEQLFESGGDLEAGANTPLMEAAQEGHTHTVEGIIALMKRQTAAVDGNTVRCHASTALAFAADNGHLDIVKALVACGFADINYQAEGNRTPLMKAAKNGYTDIIKFLLNCGADVNAVASTSDVSALSLACAGGHFDSVIELLRAGGDAHVSLKDGVTCVLEAARHGYVKIVEVLLDWQSNHPGTVPARVANRKVATPRRTSTLAAKKGAVPAVAPLKPLLPPIKDKRLDELAPLGCWCPDACPIHLDGAEGGLHAEEIPIATLNSSLEGCSRNEVLREFMKDKVVLAELLKGNTLELDTLTGRVLPTVTGHELERRRLAALAAANGGSPLLQENGSSPAAPPAVPATPPQNITATPPKPAPTPCHRVPASEEDCFVDVEGSLDSDDDENASSLSGGAGLPEVRSNIYKFDIKKLSEQLKLNEGHNSPPFPEHPRRRSRSTPTPERPTTQLAEDPPSPAKPALAPQPESAPPPVLPPQEAEAAGPTTPPVPASPVRGSAEVDLPTESNNDTPLTLACTNGHIATVELLVGRGANIHHKDKKGFTPLILAASGGHTSIVQLLLEKGAQMETQSERTKDTALSLACSGGRKEVVELLLAKGANKEHRNVSDYTPLSLAASGGYVDIVNLLLDTGAEINSRTGSKLGISPLMLSAMNGHKDATRILLERGSDINAQIETNRNTALTLACFQGRTDVVRLLLQYNANVEHRAKTGLTPLMEAANGGYVEVGELLLDAYADPNTAPVPSSRDTALTIAADKGHEHFVDLLLSHAAAIDARNKKGCTALWLAAHGGHLETVQTLVKHKASVEADDNRKVSPLMAAFRKGHVKVVKYAVKYVSQFPSDSELCRFLATVIDTEQQKSCHECMNIIVSAKDRQAAEANKAARALLEELEAEEAQALSKKASKARQKEKKKAKKQAAIKKPDGAKDDSDAEEEAMDEVTDLPVPREPSPPPPPPPPTKTERKAKAPPPTPSPPTPPLPSPEKETEKPDERVPCNAASMSGKEERPATSPVGKGPTVRKTGRRSRNETVKVVNGVAPVTGRLSPVHPSPLSPVLRPQQPEEWVKAATKKARPTGQGAKTASSGARSSSAAKECSDDVLAGWNNVDVRSRRMVSIMVGQSTIARVIGRGGANINAIREATGASIEVEKQSTRKEQLERNICVRGTQDTVKNAMAMINGLIENGEATVNEIIRQVRNSSSPTDNRPASLEKSSKSVSIPPSPAPSTTNVWQQRMAARQAQQVPAPTREPVALRSPVPPQRSPSPPPPPPVEIPHHFSPAQPVLPSPPRTITPAEEEMPVVVQEEPPAPPMEVVDMETQRKAPGFARPVMEVLPVAPPSLAPTAEIRPIVNNDMDATGWPLKENAVGGGLFDEKSFESIANLWKVDGVETGAKSLSGSTWEAQIMLASHFKDQPSGVAEWGNGLFASLTSPDHDPHASFSAPTPPTTRHLPLQNNIPASVPLTSSVSSAMWGESKPRSWEGQERLLEEEERHRRALESYSTDRSGPLFARTTAPVIRHTLPEQVLRQSVSSIAKPPQAPTMTDNIFSQMAAKLLANQTAGASRPFYSSTPYSEPSVPPKMSLQQAPPPPFQQPFGRMGVQQPHVSVGRPYASGPPPGFSVSSRQAGAGDAPTTFEVNTAVPPPNLGGVGGAPPPFFNASIPPPNVNAPPPAQHFYPPGTNGWPTSLGKNTQTPMNGMPPTGRPYPYANW